ncbi:uncharacterized protein LOC112686678 [Sipha flava]|uniref:Uncharacterized protein LOC112686678 n=1 Tax=Sipha flava TaxID=143950 RepID=A0A8B8FV58_9HEMI|nr:uncharacterized protein LOC112686678 [Sipha flava]
MGKDWHFGIKSRRKLFVPKKKPKHNLANLTSKKRKKNDNDSQNIETGSNMNFPEIITPNNYIETNIEVATSGAGPSGYDSSMSEKVKSLYGWSENEKNFIYRHKEQILLYLSSVFKIRFRK